MPSPANSFSCLKCGLTYLHHYKIRSKAMADIFAFVEAFYNSIRRIPESDGCH